MSVERVDKDAMDVKLSSTELYKPEVDTSKVDERMLLRKMDIRIVPWLGLLYLLNFLDRGAIGNAKVGVSRLASFARELTRDKLYGLETDLNITDNQYLIALTVFFFPYAIFEVCTFTRFEYFAVS
ncbi:hypothetical protein J3R82DRAFT_686 [Butyriboletus roseoflavus]|nr:hypothetical protein J3R82DRAFT_686 [Butyriboletus roseoflavus]